MQKIGKEDIVEPNNSNNQLDIIEWISIDYFNQHQNTHS